MPEGHLARLRQLKLGGMAHALEAQLEQVGTYEGLSLIERLGLLADQEHLMREHRKQDRLRVTEDCVDLQKKALSMLDLSNNGNDPS